MDIDPAAVAGGRRVAGDGSAVHGEAALLAHIDAATTAVRRTRSVIGNGSAMHGESWRCDIGVRRADEEHTAAAAAFFVVAGDRTAIHSEGRAGRRIAMLTDFHTADNCAAVQFQCSAVDRHAILEISLSSTVGQSQRRTAADCDTAGNRLPI